MSRRIKRGGDCSARAARGLGRWASALVERMVRAGRASATCRGGLWIEPLEPRRLMADVGNTLLLALDTSVGDTVANYALTEILGDGVEGASDIDVYRVRLLRGDKLTVTTSQTLGQPPMDTTVALYDAAAMQVAFSQDQPGSLFAGLIDLDIQASGDFFVVVSGAGNYNYDPQTPGLGVPGDTGVYDLSIALTATSLIDVGDRMLTAVDTGIVNTTQGNASPPPKHSFTTTGVAGDGPYVARDVDLYRFEGRAGDLLTANTSTPPGGNPGDTLLRLFKGDGTPLVLNDNYNLVGTAARLQSFALPETGVYFLGVSGSNNRFYDPALSNSGTSDGVVSDYELMLVVGDVGETSGSDAWLRNLDGPFGPVTGSYASVETLTDDNSNQADVYRIILNGGFNLDVTTALPEGGRAGRLALELVQESSGRHLALSTGEFPALHFENPIAIETYLLHVTAIGAPGDYRIDIAVTNDDPAGDINAAVATGIAPGGNTHVYEDRLLFLGDANNGLSFPFENPRHDVDMFRFEVAAGESITATTFRARAESFYQPVADTLLRLFDDAGQQVDAANDNAGDGFEVLRHTFVSGGTYYLGVSGSPNATYNPADHTSGATDGSMGEYGLRIARDVPDTTPQAQPTGTGPDDSLYVISGVLGDGPAGLRDVDMYAFEAFAGGSVTARTVNFGSDAQARLRIFDDQGQELAIDIGAGGQTLGPGVTLDAQVVHTFSRTGTYYVGVSGEGNAVYDALTPNSGIADGDAGGYNLRVYVQSPAGDDGGGVNLGDFGNLQRDPATEPRRDPGEDSAAALDTGIVGSGVFAFSDFLHATLGFNPASGKAFVAQSDEDHYRFAADAGARVRVEILPPVGGSVPIGILASLEGSSVNTYDSALETGLFAGSFEVVVGASGEHDLRVRSADLGRTLGDYRIRISVDDGQNSLGGTKFSDLNSNGLRDPGEPGLANVRVFVDENNDGLWQNTEPSDLTDASGAYLIAGLSAGPKIVREVVPQGATQTAPGEPRVYAVVRDATPANSIYAAPGGRIEGYDASGNLVRVIDHPIFDTGLLSDLELGPDGGFYVGIDTSAAFGNQGGTGVIAWFDAEGQFVDQRLLPDDDEGFFASPRGFDIDREGNLWLAQVHASKVVGLAPDGDTVETINLDPSSFPVDVAVGPDGQIQVSTLAGGARQGINYRADGLFWRAVDFPSDSDSDFVELVGGGISFLSPDPVDVQEDAAGNIWVTSFVQKSITRYSPAGLPLLTIPINGNPDGLAVVGGELLGSRYYQYYDESGLLPPAGIGFLDPAAIEPLGSPNGNPSFESGLDQWVAVGDVSVVTAAYGSTPTDGLSQALLTTGPGAASNLDLNFALARPDWYSSELGGFFGEGSMLIREIVIAQTDPENPATLWFDYNILTVDPTHPSRSDVLFAIVASDDMQFGTSQDATTPSLTAFEFETGARTASIQFRHPGAYRVAIGIAGNGYETDEVDSAVLLDNFRLTHEGRALADLGRPAHRVVLEPGANLSNLNFGNHVVDAAPQVTGALVKGSAWSSGFLSYLGAAHLGDAGGYAIPAGSGAQLAPLPWNNLNQITLRFSEPVTVQQGDLIVRGVNTAAYSIAGFSAVAAEGGVIEATWTLSSLVGVDKLLINLADTVVDAQGNALDGEWANPASRTTPAGGSSAFNSGDGAPGGDFAFRFNVVPGDANQNNGVTIQDVVQIRNRQGSSTTNAANYSIFHDINANGGITIQDVILARNQQGKSLPAGEPSLPAAALALAASGPALSAARWSPALAAPALTVSASGTAPATAPARSFPPVPPAPPAATADLARQGWGWVLRPIDLEEEEEAASPLLSPHARGSAELLEVAAPLVLRHA